MSSTKMSKRWALNCLKFFLVIPIFFTTITNAYPVEAVTLAFFRVVDKATYTKAPAKYERLPYQDPTGGDKEYVERRPAHQIPADAVKSVIISRTKILGNSAGDQEELKRAVEKILKNKSTRDNKLSETDSKRFFFRITYKFKTLEGKRFVTFANKNLRRNFQMKLGKSDLGVIPFLYPFETGPKNESELAVDTLENNADTIRDKLSPIINRVTWKNE